MTESLHPAFAAYVAASNGRDPDALRKCFAPDAVVLDEGQTYRGAEGVSCWIAHTLAAYVFTVEPKRVVRDGPDTSVTCQLTGVFPGSPVDLRFIFRLNGDKIASLEITP